jgi:hypothetical protein
MKYYCFVYPESDSHRSSTYAPFESDELAVKRAVDLLKESIKEECLDVYGGSIIVIRTTAAGERVYTEAIADVFVSECGDCFAPYVEVFEA